MRAHDWAATDLGPPVDWPESLRTAVSICLTSRFPIVVWWGPELIQLYNDAYVSILGPGKHPLWLGRSGRECWSEIWDTIGPMLDGVLKSGEATWSEELLLVLDRHLPREEGYFTFSYSPIHSGHTVGGIFCAVAETTEYVVGRRRLETLRALGSRLVKATTADAVCEGAAEALRGNPQDVPFAVLHLAASAGGTPPLAADVRGGGAFAGGWPVARVWAERRSENVALPESSGLSGGAWPESPSKALAVPVRAPGLEGVGGVLVVGVSPRRGLDSGYRFFVDAVAAQIGAALAGVAAYQAESRVRAEAERANEAKDNFLAVLSHELRSPMNAMLGWLRILKTAGKRDNDLVERAVDTLERNIWIQAQIINDLLDVSRIISGKLELDFARVDLTTAVTGCVESLRPSCAGKRVALGLELDAADLEVIGDVARLQQVMSNLLGNALKFTDAGGSVTVRVGRDNGAASIAVEDTGQGIALEFLPQIFERFSQGNDSRVRKHGGLGLGLAIVKNLVALHGGTVRAESEGSGRGARFVVELPLAEGRRSVGLPQLPPPALAGGSFPGLDVLIVEDDADSRLALALALEESGARVRHVGSVRGALEAWDAQRPDVVISDIGIPGEDGYALIRAIREREEGRGRRTLAIAMTGFAARQDREMALRAGFDEHVAKPVDLEILLERVRVLEAARSAAKRMVPTP